MKRAAVALALLASAACSTAGREQPPGAVVVADAQDAAEAGATTSVAGLPGATAADPGPQADSEPPDSSRAVAADAVQDAGLLVDSGPQPDAAPQADAPPAADAPTSPDAQVDTGADVAMVTCAVPGQGKGTCQAVSLCTGLATPGFCPGPKEIQCCVAKAVAQKCDPLAKPQPNAALGPPPTGLGNCPPGMALLSQGLAKPFCVDRWEAALEVETATGWQAHSPYWNPATAKTRAVARPGQVPQGYVSGKQADAACKAAGKRLCSDAEWLRACKGPGGTTYPYGAAVKPKLCNDSRAVHPAVEYFGTSANWIWSQLGHPCINQLPDSLATTGTYAGCVSAEGLFDLMGNLHEWTADPAGTFRGGFYVDTKLNGPGCLYATTAHDIGHWDYSTGFRCCADAP